MIKTIFAVLVLGLAAAASMTLTPASHDFGKMVVHSTAAKMFQLSSTTPVASLSVPSVTIRGRDAADFAVDSGFVSNPAGVNNPAAPANQSLPTVRASSCLAGYQAPGSCGYQVKFRPLAIGMRTAQLVVTENGLTATAALTGEGIFGCRPTWVPCNYADHFSGQFVLHSKDVAPQSSTGSYHSGQWETNITITVTKGAAFCQGSQDDVEMEFVNGKIKSSGTSKGPILGPGLFAIEIRGSGKALEYSISASCPTAHLTVTSTDYIENSVTGQVDVNSATSTVPAQPANWKDKFFTDPLPEVDPFSRVISLIGTQSDPHDSNAASGDGVSGVGTMTWNLKRW